MIDKRDERAAINLTVDKGVKERALKVLESQGMTMSGAVKAMVKSASARTGSHSR